MLQLFSVVGPIDLASEKLQCTEEVAVTNVFWLRLVMVKEPDRADRADTDAVKFMF